MKAMFKKHWLALAFKVDKRTNIVKPQQRYVTKLLRDESENQIAYTGKILSSQFNVKDKRNFEHQYDLVYYV